jgi:hypothetical protein
MPTCLPNKFFGGRGLRWIIRRQAKSAEAPQIDRCNGILRMDAFLHSQSCGLLLRRMNRNKKKKEAGKPIIFVYPAPRAPFLRTGNLEMHQNIYPTSYQR